MCWPCVGHCSLDTRSVTVVGGVTEGRSPQQLLLLQRAGRQRHGRPDLLEGIVAQDLLLLQRAGRQRHGRPDLLEGIVAQDLLLLQRAGRQRHGRPDLLEGIVAQYLLEAIVTYWTRSVASVCDKIGLYDQVSQWLKGHIGPGLLQVSRVAQWQ